MASIIPLNLDPASTFEISLEDGDFSFRVYYSTVADVWIMDLTKDGELLVNGIRLVAGQDLMLPFNFEIGQWFMVNLCDNRLDATRDDLGIDTVLLYSPQAELAEVTTNG